LVLGFVGNGGYGVGSQTFKEQSTLIITWEDFRRGGRDFEPLALPPYNVEVAASGKFLIYTDEVTPYLTLHSYSSPNDQSYQDLLPESSEVPELRRIQPSAAKAESTDFYIKVQRATYFLDVNNPDGCYVESPLGTSQA
jgi:hypothetical protein